MNLLEPIQALSFFSLSIIFLMSVWLFLIAFFESGYTAFKFVFVPLYNLYFTLTRWRQTRIPFVILILALLVFGATFLLFQYKGDPPMISQKPLSP